MTPSVILLILVFLTSECLCGFLMYKFSGNVDNRPMSSSSPCPGIFQYQTDNSGELVGVIRVEPVDHSGSVIQLDVELSVGNSVHGYNGKIVLAESREKVISDIFNRKPIFYRVYFPQWQGIPPKVTKIAVNGNLICSGPRIPIHLVPVLTTINIQHKLSLGVTPLISNSDPTVEGTFNNIAPNNGDNNPPPPPPPPENYPIDVRRDTSNNDPTVEVLEIDAESGRVDNSRNRPKGPNRYKFNPKGPRPKIEYGPGDPWVPPGLRPGPPPGPPPTDPPQQSPGGNPNQAFPQNPFFVGLSTPEPTDDTSIQIDNNPFLNSRTSQRPILFEPNSVPSSTSIPDIPQRGRPNGNALENIENICGRPIATNSLVVNGHSVPRGAYPWLVAIFRQLENVSLSYICSGSLISNRHVVTAAHCVKLETRRIKPNELLCVFGKLNIRKWVTSAGEKMLEPESIIVHPDYETGSANADIAVLTFPDPIQFNKLIRPICLWSGPSDLNIVVGKEGIVVGWGKDENGDISTAEPRQIGLPIVSQESCLRSDKNAGGAFLHITSDKTFCAGYRNGTGPCNGDSGSGFLMRKDGVFFLRGIVSTALSDATHRSCNLLEYVVFTDASKYLDWLLSVIR